jgi:hypothetical protein
VGKDRDARQQRVVWAVDRGDQRKLLSRYGHSVYAGRME